MGGNEYRLNIIRYAFNIVEMSAVSQLLHQLFGVKSFLPGDFLKIRVDLNQLGPVQDILGVAQGKEGLDAAGAAGDHAQGAGGGDGGA